MIVNDSHKQELVPARLINPGNKVEIVNSEGITVLDEVIDVSPAVTSSIKGLANIHTSTETIIVNGIVGSTLAESSTRTVAMKVARYGLILINKLAGPNMTRSSYRMAEWLLA